MLELRDPARPLLGRGTLSDQLPPRRRVVLRQKRLQRDLGEVRVAVVRLAIGVGELHRLDHRVHELPTRRVHRGKVEAAQQRQRLQQHGPLPPRPSLVQRPAVVVERRRRLVARLPRCHVRAREDAPMPLAGDVHHLGLGEVVGNGVGHEPLAPGGAGGFYARGPVCPPARAKPVVGRGEVEVAEERVRRGRRAVRQPGRGRRRPLGAEVVGEPRDRVGDARQHRMAVPRIADRRGQRLGHVQRAVVAQQQHPAVERPRHHRRQQARPRHQSQAQPAEVPDRRPGRRHPLRAKHPHLAVRRAKDHRQVARGAVQVRLHHLQDQPHDHGRIEGVAAALEHAHAGGRRDPVGRGADAEGAADLGAGGEAHSVSVRFRGGRARRAARRPAG